MSDKPVGAESQPDLIANLEREWLAQTDARIIAELVWEETFSDMKGSLERELREYAGRPQSPERKEFVAVMRDKAAGQPGGKK